MRILHIYKDYYPVLGGIENHVRQLAEAQAARGHDVTVLATSLNRSSHIEQRNGVRVIYASRLWNLSSAPLSAELFREAARQARGSESRPAPDVTHLQFPYPPGEIAHLLARWRARGRAGATVLTYQSDIVRQKVMGALYTPFLHRILAQVDTIIATSPNYVRSSPVLQRWKDKCVVVPIGIPLAPFRTVPPRPSAARASALLFVGRLRYYKGLGYLLEALTQLPDARLTVVGTGPMEGTWRALAGSLGVGERVRWVGDAADEELPGYYAGCDVFVLPCSERSEAFGLVQLEAMASARPVVSCDVNTGVAWVNRNGVTGFVAPPRDADALARVLRELLEDGALREKMGAAGRARAEAEFTLDRMVERVESVYQGAIGKVRRQATRSS